MTKDEINAQYSMNCTTIGAIYGQIDEHKKLIGEMQAKIDKLLIKNNNLNVDMKNLLNEEAKAATAAQQAKEIAADMGGPAAPAPHAIVGTA